LQTLESRTDIKNISALVETFKNMLEMLLPFESNDSDINENMPAEESDFFKLGLKRVTNELLTTRTTKTASKTILIPGLHDSEPRSPLEKAVLKITDQLTDFFRLIFQLTQNMFSAISRNSVKRNILFTRQKQDYTQGEFLIKTRHFTPKPDTLSDNL
jgi:hypothetical protein